MGSAAGLLRGSAAVYGKRRTIDGGALLSICSPVTRGVKSLCNVSAPCDFTQFASVCSAIPSDFAAAEPHEPDSTNRTASCLYSDV
jgi:hypothetical protein